MKGKESISLFLSQLRCIRSEMGYTYLDKSVRFKMLIAYRLYFMVNYQYACKHKMNIYIGTLHVWMDIIMNGVQEGAYGLDGGINCLSVSPFFGTQAENLVQYIHLIVAMYRLYD